MHKKRSNFIKKLELYSLNRDETWTNKFESEEGLTKCRHSKFQPIVSSEDPTSKANDEIKR